ncbi:MAG: hypothetical protein KKG09_00660 [Verrucomicrobia bacterium]|nr:hypothetical protein [Verrucomicrobiota bacterium]MCG2678515.1 hypothetical protein [Kiritimatiellia bacterium]MBU4248021.1 hypothetical protein [Verrucomicrobiota bacterium]MBU4289541.1 hypothetical protein [Verrucomicrobiota bacterium]MBU4427760.1 hypothetical protein [Verrucomicrobiota bacterium]
MGISTAPKLLPQSVAEKADFSQAAFACEKSGQIPLRFFLNGLDPGTPSLRVFSTKPGIILLQKKVENCF